MKKAKLFLKRILSRKLYVTVTSLNMCQIWHVEKGAETIQDALGIFPERANELLELCKTTLETSKDVVNAMVIISKECKHANELYFCSMIVTRIHVDSERPKSFIDMMLSSMAKRG